MSRNLLQIKNACKSFGVRELFQEATFSINEGEHVGVIGPNGAGKSTLFKVLTDQISLDSGEVIKAQGLQLGYLEQEFVAPEGLVVSEYLQESRYPLWKLEVLGKGLGLKPEDFQKHLKDLSGGYQMRVRLLHLLAEEPQLLLLDEPTNYLDLESIFVLENFILNFKGALLLISHDREFLKKTTQMTLEIEQTQLTKYPGSLEKYLESKALQRDLLEKQKQNQDAKKKEILKMAAKFGAKATKAKQVKSKLKIIDKMKEIELSALPTLAKIKIPEPERIGKLCLQTEDLQLGYGNITILKNITFNLERGDHLAVVGENGAGKSTLLKSLAERLEPQSGTLHYGAHVTWGYYGQHVSQELDPRLTVLSELEKDVHKDITQQDALDMAGALLFSGNDVNKSISLLSGGEKARVALGKILLQKVSFLILDEPTNHLDFYTVEALTQALHNYGGSLIVVSHDRNFIQRVAKKVLEIRNGEAHYFPGNYEEYVWSLEKGILSKLKKDLKQNKEPEAKNVRTRSSSETPSQRSGLSYTDRKQKEKELRKVEKDLIKWEESLQKLNQEMMDSPNKALQLSDELAQAQFQKDQLEERWICLSSELEK